MPAFRMSDPGRCDALLDLDLRGPRPLPCDGQGVVQRVQSIERLSCRLGVSAAGGAEGLGKDGERLRLRKLRHTPRQWWPCERGRLISARPFERVADRDRGHGIGPYQVFHLDGWMRLQLIQDMLGGTLLPTL